MCVGVLVFEKVIVPSAVISDEAKTLRKMRGINQSVFGFIKSEGRLPESLSELEHKPGDDRFEDSWGKPIQYAADPAGGVTLSSSGPDNPSGKRGGNGVEYFFVTKGSDGGWLSEAPLFPKSQLKW